MEQLFKGKSCAPACPMQLAGGFAKSGGRLVALMNKRDEDKSWANGRQLPSPLSYCWRTTGSTGMDRVGTGHLVTISPCPKISTAETPIFPTLSVPGGLGGEGFRAVATVDIWVSDGCTLLPCLQGQLDRRSSIQDWPPLLRVPAELRGRLPEQPLLQRYVLGGLGNLPGWRKDWSKLMPGRFN